VNGPTTGSVFEIWDASPPGSEAWTWRDQELMVDGELMVRNVAVPTLEVFTPAAEPNGTAVIVAPGGAYHFLMVEQEGRGLARPLAALGVIAFVLRYRLRHTPEDDDEMLTHLQVLGEHSRATPWSAGTRAIIGEEAERASDLAHEDGRQAVRFARRHATEWGIDPTRIGVAGFSAGGGVAMAAATSADNASRPDFVACLYGKAPRNPAVPDRAPPLFLVHALDDPAVPPDESVLTWQTWRNAGHEAELHLFHSGGHGFGVKRQDLASDAWILLYESWLRGLGMLDRPCESPLKTRRV
jgi:acetyl esterase/lipase